MQIAKYRKYAKTHNAFDVIAIMVFDTIDGMQSFENGYSVDMEQLYRIMNTILSDEEYELILNTIYTSYDPLCYKSKKRIEDAILKLVSSYVISNVHCIRLDASMYEMFNAIQAMYNDPNIKRQFTLTRNYFLKSIYQFSTDDTILAVMSVIYNITGYDIFRIYSIADPYDLYCILYNHKEEVFCARGAGNTVLIYLTYVLKSISEIIVRNYGKTKLKNMGSGLYDKADNNTGLYKRYYFDKLDKSDFMIEYKKL